MIRAVLDTNVYVAALLSRDGAPARLVRALEEGLFDAVTCPHLVRELEEVLARPKLIRALTGGITDDICSDIPSVAGDITRDDTAITDSIALDITRDFILWLRRVTIPAPDPSDIPPVSPDRGDDYIIALARESKAQVIVSGDTHLLGLTGLEPRVLSPATFATLVEGLR